MKTIIDHEIIDHDYMLPDYFQGCGICLTKFDDVATGCGLSRQDAYDDALEMLAQNGWDVSSIEETFSENKFVPEDCEESYYYVSVMVR